MQERYYGINNNTVFTSKMNFINNFEKYHDIDCNLTKAVMAKISSMHLDVINSFWEDRKRVSHSIHSIINNTKYFWENIFALYYEFDAIWKRIADDRLKCYIVNEFNLIYEELKKNNNIIIEYYNPIYHLQNILKKTKAFVENYSTFCDDGKIEQEFNLKFKEYSNKEYSCYTHRLKYEDSCPNCKNIVYWNVYNVLNEKYGYFALKLNAIDSIKDLDENTSFKKEKTEKQFLKMLNVCGMDDYKNKFLNNENNVNLGFFIDHIKSFENDIGEFKKKEAEFLDKNGNIYLNSLEIFFYEKLKKDNKYSVEVYLRLLKKYANDEVLTLSELCCDKRKEYYEYREGLNNSTKISDFFQIWKDLDSFLLDNNDRNRHSLYIKFVSASIFKSLKEYYNYKLDNNENEKCLNKFLDYCIESYNKFQCNNINFVAWINGKEKINTFENYQFDDVEYFDYFDAAFNKLFELLNNDIESYKEIKINEDLQKGILNIVSGGQICTLFKSFPILQSIFGSMEKCLIPIEVSENINANDGEKAQAKDKWNKSIAIASLGSLSVIIAAFLIYSFKKENFWNLFLQYSLSVFEKLNIRKMNSL